MMQLETTDLICLNHGETIPTRNNTQNVLARNLPSKQRRHESKSRFHLRLHPLPVQIQTQVEANKEKVQERTETEEKSNEGQEKRENKKKNKKDTSDVESIASTPRATTTSFKVRRISGLTADGKMLVSFWRVFFLAHLKVSEVLR